MLSSQGSRKLIQHLLLAEVIGNPLCQRIITIIITLRLRVLVYTTLGLHLIKILSSLLSTKTTVEVIDGGLLSIYITHYGQV